jgi:beta-glucanase (GH16 family)
MRALLLSPILVLPTLAALATPAAPPTHAAPPSFADSFDRLDATRWGCEYACPTVADGMARFTVGPGSLNSEATWNKLTHKDAAFGYGTYTMRFRFSRRPLETEVWAGWALFSNAGGKVNEINFGIETACKVRCSDQTLILESYKDGVNQEVIVPLGVSIVDGTWHTVQLDYGPTGIALRFGGKQVAAITDASKIPVVPMKFIPGARVIQGTLASPFHLDVDSLDFHAPGGPSGLRPQGRLEEAGRMGTGIGKAAGAAWVDARGRPREAVVPGAIPRRP